MTLEEWVSANLADAPPLSPAQAAILRPVFRPVVPRNADAAPARQQEPHQSATTTLPGRSHQ